MGHALVSALNHREEVHVRSTSRSTLLILFQCFNFLVLFKTPFFNFVRRGAFSNIFFFSLGTHTLLKSLMLPLHVFLTFFYRFLIKKYVFSNHRYCIKYDILLYKLEHFLPQDTNLLVPHFLTCFIDSGNIEVMSIKYYSPKYK